MSQKLTKIIIAAFIIVLAVVSGYMGFRVAKHNANASQSAPHTTSSFTAYVLSHHIGQIVSNEGGLGLDANAVVLQIDHMPAKDLSDYVAGLFTTYHQLDGGESLSIIYKVPKTGQHIPVAEALLNAGTNHVQIVLYNGGHISNVTVPLK